MCCAIVPPLGAQMIVGVILPLAVAIGTAAAGFAFREPTDSIGLALDVDAVRP